MWRRNPFAMIPFSFLFEDPPEDELSPSLPKTEFEDAINLDFDEQWFNLIDYASVSFDEHTELLDEATVILKNLAQPEKESVVQPENESAINLNKPAMIPNKPAMFPNEPAVIPDELPMFVDELPMFVDELPMFVDELPMALDDDFNENIYEPTEVPDPYYIEELSEPLMENAIIGYDCKLSGCDEHCTKTHYMPYQEASCESLAWGTWDELADVVSVDETHNVETNTEKDDTSTKVVVQPYTPDNDHCYYQPLHSRVTAPPKENYIAYDSMDSESASESSGEEVDVVTITEKRPIVLRYRRQSHRIAQAQRNVRKVPTRRLKACSGSTVKAASALTRTKFQPKRNVGRRKGNSVESSPASSLQSSRCNSDIEDVEKRNTHNDLERKRREAQRLQLQNLRRCIPELESNPKASKISILNIGTDYIKMLERENEDKLRLKRELQKKQARLKKHLTSIASHFRSY